MRISDWSSDVCSSDLHHRRLARVDRHRDPALRKRRDGALDALDFVAVPDQRRAGAGRFAADIDERRSRRGHREDRLERSEEHKSELQEQMRKTDAGICLKKKKKGSL